MKCEKLHDAKHSTTTRASHSRDPLTTPYVNIITHKTQHHSCVRENRQARVALGDRIKNSLQLTTLRLNPCRLQGVQALTMHYP